jgi:SAM-dependent methyltransferase
MVQRARDRILRSGLQEKVDVLQMGFHQLDDLPSETFDGVYSDLGPLNCAADSDGLAESVKRIVKPQGKIIASVIGRVCPWEWIFYILKGQWSRANLRFRPGLVPVPLNGRTVWTRYFMPSEFSNIFAASGFRLISLRAIGLFLPPPYMIGFAERHPALIDALQKLDDGIGSWPLFRDYGDHFLIVMQKHV